MRKPALMASIILVLATVMGGVALAADSGWDTQEATNNNDGGNDNGDAFSDSSDGTSDSDSDSFTSSTSTNDDSSTETDTSSSSETSASSDDSTSESWDTGEAENNDDGTSTNESWDTENSTNDDDGTSTQIQNEDTWETQEAENNDDGSSTDESWDTGEAENNDDGSGTDREREYWDTEEAENNDDGTNGDNRTPASLYSFMNPETVGPGQTVTVRGDLEGTNDEIEVRMGSDTVATTSPDSNGEFRATFQPEEVGTHTVRVSAGDLTDRHTLNVYSTVEISSVTWPDSVRRGDEFQVCADVDSQETPEVTLYKDGAEVDSKTQSGTVCFMTSAERVGNVNLRIEAETSGASDAVATTVNAYTVSDTGDTSNPGSDDNQGGFLSSVANSSMAVIGIIIAVIGAAAGAVYRFWR